MTDEKRDAGMEAARRRRFRAYELREEGRTFAQIGAELNCNAARARELYESFLWRVDHAPDDYPNEVAMRNALAASKAARA